MQIGTGVQRVVMALLVVAVAGCGPSDEAKRMADSAVAAAARANARSAAGDVISARREAQALLDSARAAYVAGNCTVAAKGLRDAATFSLAQADSATGAAKDALASSAAELERLSTRVTRGAVTSVKTLDSVFARTHMAEAWYHQQRAVVAWRGPNGAQAGAELIMVADHLDRAMADAGRVESESAKTAIADARALGSKLAQGIAVQPADVAATFTAVEREVANLFATLKP